MGILDEYPKHAVKHFEKDFSLIVKMAMHMDEDFGMASTKFDYNKPFFEKTLEEFSKKYRTMVVKPLFDETDKFFRIFFIEKSLNQCFASSLSKINGCRSAGTTGLDLVPVANSKELEYLLKKPKNKLYVRYFSGSVILECCKDNGMLELIYDTRTIRNVNGPEFKVCCFYALQGNYDAKSDLQKLGSKFVFTHRGVMRGMTGPRK